MRYIAVILFCCLLRDAANAQVTCQTDTDCLNSGLCKKNPSDSSNSYCHCTATGYGGDDCSQICLKKCENGSSCRFHDDISDGFHEEESHEYCECVGDYQGSNCEIPFKLCPDGLKCLHGGTCVGKSADPADSYRCECPSGRSGNVCEVEVPLSSNTGTFECQMNSHCFNGGTCIQGGSQFICQCQTGFGGQDCATSCTKACENGGSCRFHDDISDGFHGEQSHEYCECVGNYQGASCEVPFNVCPDGHKCLHGGICVTETTDSASYECDCIGGRSGDTCENEAPGDPAVPSDCQTNSHCMNGGSCVKGGEGWICQCKTGFGGSLCADTCLKTCRNGGSCRFHDDVSDGFHANDSQEYCECVGDFKGVNCEVPFMLCPDGLQCLHGGACQQQANNGGGYICNCPTSRTGDVCQAESKEDSSKEGEKGAAQAVGIAAGGLFGVGILTYAIVNINRSRTPVDTAVSPDAELEVETTPAHADMT